MSLLNNDIILNSNPVKRLMVSFDHLKEDFSEEAALKYRELYKDLPLSLLLNSSRYIYSIPLHGVDDYLRILTSPYMMAFGELKNQYDALKEYLNEYWDKMGNEQKGIYTELKKKLKEYKKKYKQTAKLYNYIADKCKVETMEIITDKIFELSRCQDSECELSLINELESFFTDECENPFFFFIFTPYLTSITSIDFVTPSLRKYYHDTISEDLDDLEFNLFEICNNLDVILILSKLMKDEAYQQAVSSIPNRATKIILKKLSQVSIKDELDELFTERVDLGDSYISAMNAVQSIFDDDNYFEMAEEEAERNKINRSTIESIIINRISDMVLYEYQTDDINDFIDGYNFFEENTTIEQAINIITEKENVISGRDGHQTSKVVARHSTNIREESTKSNKKREELSDDDNDDDHDDDEIDLDIEETNEAPNNNRKKITKQKEKNLANKIQFSAMDKESDQYKKMGERREKIDDVKNAAKAVTNIPKNVLDSLKDTANQIDEADNERRKQYMIAPGFRKKVFRNLKLAILYGGTAHIKLGLVPVTMLVRHFSKSKDYRIRRELARELDTEIKIVEEKISDANANGDQKEKYRLMRIKSKLEQEALRVKTNSKLI